MARTARLRSRQEHILEDYLRNGQPVMTFDELPSRVRSKLRRVSDHETLHQDVSRWLMDNNNPHLRDVWGSATRVASRYLTR
jgi:hypothetical protein